MDSRAFVELVRDVLGAMGQGLEAARPVPEGLALSTQDGYLYVFVADASRGSEASIDRWVEAAQIPHDRLVVFSLRSLPSYWGPELERRGATIVAGATFERLVEDLGIETTLIPPERGARRRYESSLPSLRELEADMCRAETWYAAGVLPLAQRFYASAASLKPEYLPALLGQARSFAGLEEWPSALVAWDRVLEVSPGLPEARLGRAAAAGSLGDRDGELAEYRGLVREHPEMTSARVALFASLVERGEWTQARTEIERLLDQDRNEPRLRYLHGLVLVREGLPAAGEEEKGTAMRLGLDPVEAARLDSLALPSAERPGRESSRPRKAL